LFLTPHPSPIGDTFSHWRRLADINLSIIVSNSAKIMLFINQPSRVTHRLAFSCGRRWHGKAVTDEE